MTTPTALSHVLTSLRRERARHNLGTEDGRASFRHAVANKMGMAKVTWVREIAESLGRTARRTRDGALKDLAAALIDEAARAREDTTQ